MIDIPPLRQLAPLAKAEYIAAFDLTKTMESVNTPLRLVHFLAQVLHETDGLTIFRESMNYTTAARIVEIFGQGHHSAAITPAEAAVLASLKDGGRALAERVYGVKNPKKARELGNAEIGDGWRYRGGGMLQATGRASYRRLGQELGENLEHDPELIIDPHCSLRAAINEWCHLGCNAPADRDDIRGVTKRVNGGTNGLASREAWLIKAKSMVGG